MVLLKQALLPVAAAQIASFGLVTGRTNARWRYAHMSICKVSMEMLLVMPPEHSSELCHPLDVVALLSPS